MTTRQSTPNPQTLRDALRELPEVVPPDEVGREIFSLVERVARGELSKSEALGHQEFILTYKQFEPIGPACLPAA